MAFKAEKIHSLIKEEMGSIFLREMDFGGALVTITEVKTNKNMREATIGVSVIPSEAAAKVLIKLAKNRNRLQHFLREKTLLSPMPYIVFEIDHGLENAAEVEKIILGDKIKE